MKSGDLPCSLTSEKIRALMMVVDGTIPVLVSWSFGRGAATWRLASPSWSASLAARQVALNQSRKSS
jgi:hypothetical protein